MSETRAIIKMYCAHPVQKEIDPGAGAMVITAKCGKPMTHGARTVRNYSGNGDFIESIEHGTFCEDGHRAGRK